MAVTTAKSFLLDCPVEAQQRILTALSQYNSLKTAAKLARVSPSKLRVYFSYAQQQLDDPAFDPEDYSKAELALFEFYQAAQSLEAEAESAQVLSITRATEKDWKAAAHLLKMRNPEDWSDTKASQSAVPTDTNNSAAAAQLLGSPGLDLNLLTADELVMLETLLRKATPKLEVIENTPQPLLSAGPNGRS